jgi:antitoxin component of MazEF toxin-antitoxin module
MSQYINTLRQQGNSLVVTIPSDFVRELGLVRGDRAVIRREPDGLRLRIIRHSTLVELANAQENQMAEEGPVAAAE